MRGGEALVGAWRWRIDGRLTLIPSSDSAFVDLAGEWTLPAFLLELEGLSRAQLQRALETADGEVDCRLRLSDGRRLGLVGSIARGEVRDGQLLDIGSKTETNVPGPPLAPVFQPIVDLASGRVAGFEALARWPGGPDAYADPGLASNMLMQSAEALSDWRRVPAGADVFVNVNLTGRDLAEGAVPALIEALALSHGLPPGYLRIELTEQAALRDPEAALEAVRAIKAAGAGVILDDFGSGHSSFAWLADMPADGLKIDPDLTRRLKEPRARVILEAVTLLARRLGMSTTAEGVEAREHAAVLRNLGFDYVQGFAFFRPMAADRVVPFLETGVGAPPQA